jgi:hypothetical protein
MEYMFIFRAFNAKSIPTETIADNKTRRQADAGFFITVSNPCISLPFPRLF